MTERETTRLIAWSHELREVHRRLREALEVTQKSVADAALDRVAMRDLLLFCHGFCTALNGHHRGEDRTLFPAIVAAYPELGPVLRSLSQEHSMIAHLLGGLQAAVDRGASAEELGYHLEGVAAVMESHFRYEERQLLRVLEDLDLATDPRDVLGPL
ncbi:MAG: hemerythrin domain-containing protein [Ornithinimicrobium sp.]